METVYRHSSGTIYPEQRLEINPENGDFILDPDGGRIFFEKSSMTKIVWTKRIYVNPQTREIIRSPDMILDKGRVPPLFEVRYILSDEETEVRYRFEYDGDQLDVPEHWLTINEVGFTALNPASSDRPFVGIHFTRHTQRPGLLIDRIDGERIQTSRVIIRRSHGQVNYHVSDHPSLYPHITTLPDRVSCKILSKMDTRIFSLGRSSYVKSEVTCLNDGYIIYGRFYSHQEVIESPRTANPEEARNYIRNMHERLYGGLDVQSTSPHGIPVQRENFYETHDVSNSQRVISHGITVQYFHGTHDKLNGGLITVKYLDYKPDPMRNYCPDLFNYKVNGLGLDNPNYHRLFPGYNFTEFSERHRFRSSSTFYSAAAAPDDWEDLYGESFSNRSHVYALVPLENYDGTTFYSSEELISSFFSQENFIDPKTKKTFTKEQIGRLEVLTKDKDHLLEAIIRELGDAQHNIMKAMRRLSEQENFKNVLNKIFEIGMIMRGWTGGDYPLQEKDTKNPVDQLKLSSSLLSLELEPFGELRLMKFLDHKWTFHEHTLGERLKIVIDGNRVDACIRMTSNTFARTAWFYLDTFFNERPFELTQLENIV